MSSPWYHRPVLKWGRTRVYRAAGLVAIVMVISVALGLAIAYGGSNNSSGSTKNEILDTRVQTVAKNLLPWVSDYCSYPGGSVNYTGHKVVNGGNEDEYEFTVSSADGQLHPFAVDLPLGVNWTKAQPLLAKVGSPGYEPYAGRDAALYCPI